MRGRGRGLGVGGGLAGEGGQAGGGAQATTALDRAGRVHERNVGGRGWEGAAPFGRRRPPPRGDTADPPRACSDFPAPASASGARRTEGRPCMARGEGPAGRQAPCSPVRGRPRWDPPLPGAWSPRPEPKQRCRARCGARPCAWAARRAARAVWLAAKAVRASHRLEARSGVSNSL